jgi:hypothetical protein
VSARELDYRRRIWRVAIVLAAVTGVLIWNLVFDMWQGQVERQYLFEQARHELHRGPGAALKVVNAQGIRDGALVATGWTAVVVAAILGVAWYATRLLDPHSRSQSQPQSQR